MAFDPDAFLAKVAPAPSAPSGGGFDPDAFLAKVEKPKEVLIPDRFSGSTAGNVAATTDSGTAGGPARQLGTLADTPVLPALESVGRPGTLPTAGRAIYNTLRGFATPKNVAIGLATGGLASEAQAGNAIAKTALAHALGWFSYQGAKAIPEDYKKYVDTLRDPNASAQEQVEAALKLPVDAAMALGGAKGIESIASERVLPNKPSIPEVQDPKALPEPAPAQLPAPAAPKAPSIVTKIESVQGNSTPADVNAAANAAIIAPQAAPAASQPPAPAMPAPAEDDLLMPKAEKVAKLPAAALKREAALKAQDPEKYQYLDEQRKLNGPDRMSAIEFDQAVKGALKGLQKPSEMPEVAQPAIGATETPATAQIEPTAKETAPAATPDLFAQVSGMTHDEFKDFAHTVPGGFTTKAIELGNQLGAEGVGKLESEAKKATAAFKRAMKRSETDPNSLQTAINLSNKAQFFSEAAQAAKGTLSHLEEPVPKPLGKYPTDQELSSAAATQRDIPESQMMRTTMSLQKKGGSAVLGDLLEHVGDLAHRLQEPGQMGMAPVGEKLRKLNRLLNPPNGMMSIEQELEHALQGNAEYRVIQKYPELQKMQPAWKGYEVLRKDHASEIEAEKQTIQQAYKEELPAYVKAHETSNQPITKAGQLGKDAAIALGNMDFKALRKIAAELTDFYEKNKGKKSIYQRNNQANAIRKQATSQVDVGEQAGDGQRVGQQDQVSQVPAQQSVPVGGSPAPSSGPLPPSPAQAVTPSVKDAPTLIDSLKKSTARALSSPTVDVMVKKEIAQALKEGVGGSMSNFNKLPVSALAALADKLDTLEQKGRQLVKERQAQYDAQKARVEADIQSHGGRFDENIPLDHSLGRREGKKEAVLRQAGNATKTGVNVISSAFGQTMVADVIADRMDGDANYLGPIVKHYIGTIDRNYNLVEHPLRQEFKKGVKEVLARYPIDHKSMERVNIYGISRTKNGMQHLRDSGVSDARVKEVAESLTDGEKALYAAARDTFDQKVLPQLKKFMHETFNIDVQAEPNYWPLQRDWSAYEQAKAPDQPETAKEEMNGFGALAGWKGALAEDFMPTRTTAPKKGFTIARKEGAGGAVNLSTNLIDRHLNSVSHLLAHARDVKMLGQIARQSWFSDKYGKNYQKFILDRLDTIARDSAPIGATRIAALDWLASNVSVAILGLRALSQAKHISNAAIAVREINPDFLFRGVKDAYSNEGSAFIKRVAPEIFQRAGGEQAISELVQGSTYRQIQGKFFVIERAIDQAVARASFIGAYMESLAKQGIDPEHYADIKINDEALRHALIISRKVTTSPLLKDAPQAITRGSLTGKNMTAKRILFQFQQTLMRIGTNFKHEAYDLGLKKGDYKKAVASLLTYLTVILITSEITMANKHLMGYIGHKVLGGPMPRPEQGSHLEHLAKEGSVEALRLIPGGSQSAAILTRGDTGVPLVDTARQEGAAAGRVLITHKNQYGQPLRGLQLKKDIADVATGIGSALGIPGVTTIGQIYKSTLRGAR